MGKKKKKNKNLGPRSKRMNRKGRLQSGREWIKTYEGNHIIKGYAKWYGVTKLCAMIELEMLGLKFSEKKKAGIRRAEEDRIRQKQLRKERRKKREEQEFFDSDSDDVFAFIAGYTAWGFPYGITHEEMEGEDDWHDMSFLETNADELEFDDEQWEEPSEDEWVEYLLNKRPTTPIKWENEHWYSDSYVWETYFGPNQPIEHQDKLVDELNRFDLLKQIRDQGKPKK